MQKKLVLFGTKQEEMCTKLTSMASAVPPKDSGLNVKVQLDTFNVTLKNLAGDNAKILAELAELKESVVLLTEKGGGNYSDYDEEDGMFLFTFVNL